MRKYCAWCNGRVGDAPGGGEGDRVRKEVRTIPVQRLLVLILAALGDNPKTKGSAHDGSLGRRTAAEQCQKYHLPLDFSDETSIGRDNDLLHFCNARRCLRYVYLPRYDGSGGPVVVGKQG